MALGPLLQVRKHIGSFSHEGDNEMKKSVNRKKEAAHTEMTQLIDEEVIRSRIRKIIDSPERLPTWQRITTNPLLAVVLGFLLTGLVGTLLTNHYNSKQKELEFELNAKQLAQERQRDERQKEFEFERNKRQRDFELESEKRQKEQDRDRDERLKESEDKRTQQQQELERERAFAIELSRIRVEKVGEVWEKVYLYEATAQKLEGYAETLLQRALISASLNIKGEHPTNEEDRRKDEKRREELGEKIKVYEVTRQQSQILHNDLLQVLNKNRFWIGEDSYSRIEEYLRISSEYIDRLQGGWFNDTESVAKNPSQAVVLYQRRLNKMKEEREKLRDNLIRIRKKFLAE